MKRIIVLLLLCGWCSLALAVAPPAQKYFDQATTRYLVGDLDAALKLANQALEIEPAYLGAMKLKQSILREMSMTAKVVPQVAAPPPPEEVPAAPAVAPAAAPSADNYQIIWAGFVMGSLVLLIIVIFLAGRLKALLFSGRGQAAREAETEAESGGSKMFRAISEEQQLWYRKMNWRDNPFTLDVDPELFTGHEKEIKEVMEKINSHSGHILIVGPLGIGKTTFLRWLAKNLPRRDYHPVYIPRPPLDFNQLVAHVFQSLGYTPEQARAEGGLYNLTRLRSKVKQRLIILLDEAHEFTIEVERPLRTLGDIDGVNLVMVGLPETIDKLKNEIQPLYERLVLKITLDRLAPETLTELIRVRIASVGGTGLHPFKATALEKIYEISQGNPRRAIKLCDNAVSQAISRGEELIGPEIIRETEGF
jgi:type II secretory pathway predicted ATPase ExeA